MTDQELQNHAESIVGEWPTEKRKLFAHYLLKCCWWMENPTEEATKIFRAFRRSEEFAAYDEEFFDAVTKLLNAY